MCSDYWQTSAQASATSTLVKLTFMTFISDIIAAERHTDGHFKHSQLKELRADLHQYFSLSRHLLK